MIQVNILRDRNEVVKGIDINGHAGYAEYGQDVICAAVSVPDKISSESQLLMKSLILGLENIRDEYGAEYIKFRFREV